MQFSNGLSNPAGLWLGHLAFDTIFTVVASSITVIIYSVASNELHGLAFLVSEWNLHLDQRLMVYIVVCTRSIWLRRNPICILRVSHCQISTCCFCRNGGVSSSCILSK